INSIWQIADGCGVDHARHRATIAAHSHDVAAKTAAHYGVDQALNTITLPVDDNPFRGQQPMHRDAFRAMFPALHDADGGISRQDRKLDGEYAILDALGDPVAGISKNVGHPPVLGEHLSNETADAAFPCRLSQVL